jgi:hypothetical protein
VSVYTINNFISRDVASTVVDILHPRIVATPREHVSSSLGWPSPAAAAKVGTTEDCYIDDSKKTVTGVFIDILKKVGETFDEDVCLVNAFYNVMHEGAEHSLHCDNVNLDGSPLEEGVEEPNKWSGVLYLNDYGIDYSGGEINFPNQELTIKPETGTFVYFKTDVDHPHEVLKVLSGERKCLVVFFGELSDVTSNKYSWNVLNGEN